MSRIASPPPAEAVPAPAGPDSSLAGQVQTRSRPGWRTWRDTRPGPHRRATLRESLSAALPAWILARLVVGGALAVAHLIVTRVGAGDLNPPALMGGLLAWDASWYREIAAHGYAVLGSESLRFFPLVPALARLVGLPLGGHPGWGLVLVANASALAFCAVLYALALEETGDTDMAGRAAWLAALAPPAFVLVMGYAEAPALALSVAAFLALRRHRWGWAAAAGAAAALARPAGILLMVPAAYEAVRGLRRCRPPERIARVGAALAPLGGTSVFLAFVGMRFGDPLFPLRIQARSDLRGRFVDPVSRLIEAGRDAAHGLWAEGFHLLWALVFLTLLVVVLRRWPLAYGLFAAAGLALALTAENLNSFERYGFAAFPLILGAATAIRGPLVDLFWRPLCAVLLGAYSLLMFVGLYLP